VPTASDLLADRAPTSRLEADGDSSGEGVRSGDAMQRPKERMSGKRPYWMLPERTKRLPRNCSFCGAAFIPASPQQFLCSPACRRARRREQDKHPPRERTCAPGEHPYLLATNAVAAELTALPPERRSAHLDVALSRLVQIEGPRFAEIVAWALRERAMRDAAAA